jgi:hypothetical protein
MPTIKQRKALENIIENHGNISKAMRDAGYDEDTAKSPSRNLTNSVGFKQLLEEMGLTQELITTALVDDIKDKPGKRLGELTLGANILGMTKPEVSNPTNNTLNVNILNSPRVNEIVADFEEKLKKELSKPPDETNQED